MQVSNCDLQLVRSFIHSVVIAGFMGLYGSYKITRGPAALMYPFSQSAKKKDPSLMRLSRDHVSLEARLANMMSFWALWHVAWVVKSIPFFKLTVEQIAPKYLLVEMVVMLFCLNCWFVPAGAPPGFRVGVSTSVLSFTHTSVANVQYSVCLVRISPGLPRARAGLWSGTNSEIAVYSYRHTGVPRHVAPHPIATRQSSLTWRLFQLFIRIYMAQKIQNSPSFNDTASNPT